MSNLTKEQVRSAVGVLVKWLEEYHELDMELLKFEHPAEREMFYRKAEDLLIIQQRARVK